MNSITLLSSLAYSTLGFLAGMGVGYAWKEITTDAVPSRR